MIARLVPFVAFILLMGCAQPDAADQSADHTDPAPAVESPAQPQADTPEIEAASPEVAWIIDTAEGTYGMPESTVYASINGVRIPVFAGPGLVDMTPEQREQYAAPDGALAAAGFWGGAGKNILMFVEGQEVVAQEAYWDTQSPAEWASSYQEIARLSVASVEALRDQQGPIFDGCFEGSDETRTLKVELDVHMGNVVGELQTTIHDEANGYYTSASTSAAGVLLDGSVYVEVFIRIELDEQRSVEIWSWDGEQLTIDGLALSACSV